MSPCFSKVINKRNFQEGLVTELRSRNLSYKEPHHFSVAGTSGSSDFSSDPYVQRKNISCKKMKQFKTCSIHMVNHLQYVIQIKMSKLL
jgi:hypothetical protein